MTPSARGPLHHALRILLLPARAGRERAAALVLRAFIRERAIPRQDAPLWVGLQLDTWRDTGTPPPPLRVLISSVLASGDAVFGPVLAGKYFDVHAKLQTQHLFSHSEAVACLSHAFLVADLAKRERMSAAQIAKHLNNRDARVLFSWESVQRILNAFGLAPSITLAQVESTFRRDAKFSLPAFADADSATAAAVVSEAATRLGFPGDLEVSLNVLWSALDDRASHAPYIQLLHFQCCIAEFFDHAVTDAYEFAPRGNAAKWLFDEYPPLLSDASNPFLNNAKSVERLDSAWARSKKPNERPGATALAAILSGLEEMSFAARRELAGWLRLWIHRVLRRASESIVPMPDALSLEQVRRLLRAVSAGNTGTYGILEQRVVDAMMQLRYPEAAGWRHRGIGDPVNASNVSKRKLGDCDFQHPTNAEIAAFEAHGGILSSVYIDEHLRTLRKAIRLREDELQGIADLGRWTVNLTFIAHGSLPAPRSGLEIEGLTINVHMKSFADAIAEADSDPNLVASVDAHVLRCMTHGRIPAAVRSRFLEIVS